MLLLLLEEEQAEKLKHLSGVKSVVLNGETNNEKTHTVISAEDYTYDKPLPLY